MSDARIMSRCELALHLEVFLSWFSNQANTTHNLFWTEKTLPFTVFRPKQIYLNNMAEPVAHCAALAQLGFTNAAAMLMTNEQGMELQPVSNQMTDEHIVDLCRVIR